MKGNIINLAREDLGPISSCNAPCQHRADEALFQICPHLTLKLPPGSASLLRNWDNGKQEVARSWWDGRHMYM